MISNSNGSGGIIMSFESNELEFTDNVDKTKKMNFNLSSLSTNSSIILSVPTENTKLIGTETQDILKNKDLSDNSNSCNATKIKNIAISSVAPLSGETLVYDSGTNNIKWSAASGSGGTSDIYTINRFLSNNDNNILSIGFGTTFNQSTGLDAITAYMNSALRPTNINSGSLNTTSILYNATAGVQSGALSALIAMTFPLAFYKSQVSGSTFTLLINITATGVFNINRNSRLKIRTYKNINGMNYDDSAIASTGLITTLNTETPFDLTGTTLMTYSYPEQTLGIDVVPTSLTQFGPQASGYANLTNLNITVKLM